MGAEYVESDSDEIITWAPLSLLPPGLLVSSRRKPAFNEPKGKGKAKANEEAEDGGDDSRSENEGLEFDEWEDKCDTGTDFLTAGESESAAGASHGGNCESSAIVEKPAGKGRGPAGQTSLGFFDLTDSGTGELGEYGRITMRGDRKKQKSDEVIDLTTRGDRKKQRLDEVIDLTGSDD